MKIELTRTEAEMLVDLCENTCDRRLHDLSREMRKHYGMTQPKSPPDLAPLGIPLNDLKRIGNVLAWHHQKSHDDLGKLANQFLLLTGELQIRANSC